MRTLSLKGNREKSVTVTQMIRKVRGDDIAHREREGEGERERRLQLQRVGSAIYR
jgi:hypothetical protein